MISRKTLSIFLICGILAVLFIFYGFRASAGTLSCTVATTCATGTVIWRMSGTSNAHAELPGQANYAQLVCCTGVTGLSNLCSGTHAIVLRLSSVTNAHVEQNSLINYANNVCISVPAGGTVSVGYQAGNCAGFNTTLGSMSGTTNAHVGDGAAYATKICATAAADAAAQTLTFSLGVNSLALGTLSRTAVTTGSHTLTVGTNAASGVAVTFSGATLTSGANTITACSTNCSSTAGSEQFAVNAVANTSPSVGAVCSGTAPIASAATNYNTANSFRFVSGETIVSSTGAINSTTCTISYIANIAAITEAGSYSSALTFIATATF